MTFKGSFFYLIMKLLGFLPLQDKAVFSSFGGSCYNDSPKYIYEAMRRKYGDSIKYIWIMNDENTKIDGAHVVKNWSFRSLYERATAKLWIDNVRKVRWETKRKHQYYVQTWHGNLALKKIEKDVASVLEKSYLASAKHDSQIVDLMISGSRWQTENYKSAFWYDGKILEVGTPKSDIFYQDASLYQRKVRAYYHLKENIKIALYVPTFRVDGNLKCYNMDYRRLLAALEHRFGGEWVLLIRLHPNIAQSQNQLVYSKAIYNASTYDDVNELIASSDFIITDYSSCMFDGMEAGKMVTLYASDLKAYLDDRGVYFRFEELPIRLNQSNDELISYIETFNKESYFCNVKEFLKKQGIFNNGHASERTAEYIYHQVWGKAK